jgi:hypothetical protein
VRLNNKELLLLSSRVDDQEFGSQLAALFGFRFNHTQSPKEAAQFIAKSEPTVTLVDANTEPLYLQFENEFQNFVGLFGDQAFPERIHFLSDQDESCSYLFRSPIFSHLLVRGGSHYRSSIADYSRLIQQVMSQPQSISAEGLLKKDTKTQKVKLTQSGQKKDVLEAIRQYVLKAGFNSRMISLIVNATDELLMNAIYDAAKDEKGTPIHAQTPRSALFPLDAQNQVELSVGFDGQHLAITVTDLHGSLDREELFSLMGKEYSGTEYKLRRHGEGAGLGLATVFRTGASLFFHCIQKKKTEVTLIFKRVDQYKDFRTQMKFVSTHFQT